MIVLLFQIKNVEKPVSDLDSNTDAPGLVVDAADSKLPALDVADQPGVDVSYRYITNVASHITIMSSESVQNHN